MSGSPSSSSSADTKDTCPSKLTLRSDGSAARHRRFLRCRRRCRRSRRLPQSRIPRPLAEGLSPATEGLSTTGSAEKVEEHLSLIFSRDDKEPTSRTASARPPTFVIELHRDHFVVDELAMPYSAANQRFLRAIEEGRLPWDQLRAMPALLRKAEHQYVDGTLMVEVVDRRLAEGAALRCERQRVLVYTDNDCVLQDLAEMHARRRPPRPPPPRPARPPPPAPPPDACRLLSPAGGRAAARKRRVVAQLLAPPRGDAAHGARAAALDLHPSHTVARISGAAVQSTEAQRRALARRRRRRRPERRRARARSRASRRRRRPSGGPFPRVSPAARACAALWRRARHRRRGAERAPPPPSLPQWTRRPRRRRRPRPRCRRRPLAAAAAVGEG